MRTPRRVLVECAVEGATDEAVVRRLVHEAGAEVDAIYGGNGKPHLLRRLRAYNNAARRFPWVAVVDLDNDESCAPPAARKWLPHPSARMVFAIAVRQVEAWLLADAESLASFLRVARSSVPRRPEDEEDAKRALVNLARHSRSRNIRADMVPRPYSGRAVGPAYVSRLIEFVGRAWCPDSAADRAASLMRTRRKLAELVRFARDDRNPAES